MKSPPVVFRQKSEYSRAVAECFMKYTELLQVRFCSTDLILRFLSWKPYHAIIQVSPDRCRKDLYGSKKLL